MTVLLLKLIESLTQVIHIRVGKRLRAYPPCLAGYGFGQCHKAFLQRLTLSLFKNSCPPIVRKTKRVTLADRSRNRAACLAAKALNNLVIRTGTCPIVDQSYKLRLCPFRVPDNALHDIIGGVKRHQLRGGDNIYLIHTLFSHRH